MTEIAVRMSVRLRMPIRRCHRSRGCVLCLRERAYLNATYLNSGMTSVANSSAERRVSANVMSPKANSREK